VRVAVRWASGELVTALARLTGQQARGVVRIVQAELAGRPLSSLLDGPDQMCTSTTYYGSGKRRGWRGKAEFREAVALARRDYRKWMLEQGTSEALTILASTAPEAARALRVQVVGDEVAIAALEVALSAQEPELRANAARRLGQTELVTVAPALWRALEREREAEVQEALVEALGQIAGARDGERRAAALAVLDRGDVRTAAKAAVSVNQEEYLEPLADLDDEELEQVIANLEMVGSDNERTG